MSPQDNDEPPVELPDGPRARPSEEPSLDDLRIRPSLEPILPPEDPTAPAWSAASTNKVAVVRISKRTMWMAAVAILSLLVVGVLLVVTVLPRFLSSPGTAGAGDGSGAAADAGRRIQATLFYVSDDGGGLVPANRAVLYGASPAEQAKRIVEAVVADPPEGRRSPIPAGTTVRSVFLGPAGQAYVDLGGAIRSGHSGGTLDEALTVYAVVNALTINLPGISAVQILVEGQQVDTLAGHVDLRYPLGKALDWVRKGS